MTDLTIGQRIAERRKLLNLSQEALGEKMGVSRQAISKWEADAAVPEIDKLVSLSKLFSVSVGWLLGTESESAGAEQKDSFTEEQLRMVEEIVKRYHQPPRKNANLIPAVVTGALFLLAAGIAVSIFFGDYVNQEMDVIHSQISNLYSYYASIQSQLGDVSARLYELAQWENLLSQYSLEASAWEDMTGATVRFTAIPKSTQAGDQAWLLVRRNGEEVANAMCRVDGSAYTAEVELPAADGYSYYFQVVHTGGGSSQQVLEDTDDVCENLNWALRGSVYAETNMWGLEEGTLCVDLWVHWSDPYLCGDDSNLEWSQTDLVLLRNGVEIDRMSLLDKSSDGIRYGQETAVIGRDQTDVVCLYEYAIPDLTETDMLTLQLEYRSIPSNPVTVQPVVRLWLENGELEVEHYALAEK